MGSDSKGLLNQKELEMKTCANKSQAISVRIFTYENPPNIQK